MNIQKRTINPYFLLLKLIQLKTHRLNCLNQERAVILQKYFENVIL